MTTAKTTNANMRDYCTLLAALLPGTPRERLQAYASNFRGRLSNHKSTLGVEGTANTESQRRLQAYREAEPELYVEEVKAMMLCILKLCEEERDALSTVMQPSTRDGPGAPSALAGPAVAAGTAAMNKSAGSQQSQPQDERDLLGWTSRRPGVEKSEATVVGMVNNDSATAADRARYREVATASASFVLLRRLMGMLLPRLKQYAEEHRAEAPPGALAVVPSIMVAGSAARGQQKEAAAAPPPPAAIPAHRAVPIPFEVLWREVVECGLRPLVAAPGMIQPGSGYVTLALKQDLADEQI